MNKMKRKFYTCLSVFGVLYAVCQPVLAVTEAEVEAQVAVIGKEGVAGNVLVWFLCAVAFLKVSQKVDSFMSSLGINVGHTGGSLIGEMMMAAKAVGIGKGSSGGGSGSGGGSAGGHSGGFLSGGLAGVVSRSVTKGAIRSTTAPESGPGSGVSSGIGGRVYASSVEKGGDFANSVIGTVATGNISTMGSITGSKASKALQSYMGYAGMEPGVNGTPSFSDVEIGGGRITGVERTVENPEGLAFAMYNTAQYTAPEGNYSKVVSADGNEWYKQYATDAVEKTPYMAPDGSVAYQESIIKKLPPVPRRKDKL